MMSNLRKRSHFILLEILVAFTIVSFSLACFFSYFSWNLKHQLQTMQLQEDFLKVNTYFVEFLKALPQEQLLKLQKSQCIDSQQLHLTSSEISLIVTKEKETASGDIAQTLSLKYIPSKKSNDLPVQLDLVLQKKLSQQEGYQPSSP